MFTLLKKSTTSSLRRALRNVRTEYRISKMHQEGKRAARAYANDKNLKLHVGCGHTIKPGWVNVDLNRSADVSLDLREPLPFADGSCSMVYSEHFVEHLEYPAETTPFLRESFRVLQTDGIFSLGVPDMEWPIRAYAGDAAFAGWFKYVAGAYPASQQLTTRAEFVNYSFRQVTEHKFAWDFETMNKALSLVGFTEIKRRSFDPFLDSAQSHFAFGANMASDTTLYVEARKP